MVVVVVVVVVVLSRGTTYIFISLPAVGWGALDVVVQKGRRQRSNSSKLTVVFTEGIQT